MMCSVRLPPEGFCVLTDAEPLMFDLCAVMYCLHLLLFFKNNFDLLFIGEWWMTSTDFFGAALDPEYCGNSRLLLAFTQTQHAVISLQLHFQQVEWIWCKNRNGRNELEITSPWTVRQRYPSPRIEHVMTQVEPRSDLSAELQAQIAGLGVETPLDVSNVFYLQRV